MHKGLYVHALDVRVENSKILQFLGPNIRWHQWRSSISLQILDVHERLHSCTFKFWTYVDVRLRLLQLLDVRVGMAKDRRKKTCYCISMGCALVGTRYTAFQRLMSPLEYKLLKQSSMSESR